MNRFTQGLVIFTCLVLLAGGAGAAWVFRDRLLQAPKPTAEVEYARFVELLGGDEPAVRDELNELAYTSTATMSKADQAKAHALTMQCLDPKSLLEIDHVKQFLSRNGEGMAYHFVSEEHRVRLKQYAGDRPTPAKVLEVRKMLANLGREFALLRQPPDFTLKVEGNSPPALPFLDLIRESCKFQPGDQPVLRDEPRIAAFSSAEGELLAQLEQYFNSQLLRKAFPPGKYPKLYKHARMSAIPTGIADYRKEVGDAVGEEKHILLPGEMPDPEGVEAVNEIYSRLERFFSAIVSCS